MTSSDSGYRFQPASLDREPRRVLNPILEESDDENDSISQRIYASSQQQSGRRADTSHLKIEAWLSPMSDHFPTPRGNHYLAAPVFPPTSSTTSSEPNSPATSSNPWNRASVGTANTEFEDLYDVSDSDDACSVESMRRTMSQPSKPKDRGKRLSKNKLTPLSIPERRTIAEEPRSAMDEFKKLHSPVPVTPSFQLTMSPAQMNFMDLQKAQALPNTSAPPSLDGSLTSEQLAQMSAPPTPVIGHEDLAHDEVWAGVHLQPGALATLQSLSTSWEEELHDHSPQVIEVTASQPAVPEMQQQQQQPSTTLRVATTFPLQNPSRRHPARDQTRQSLSELTRLDIPSPGGFFSNLSPRSRDTWDSQPVDAHDAAPPTSTTAEHFYRCPWTDKHESIPPVPQRPDSAEGFYRDSSISSAPIEQVIEVSERDDLSDDGLPTARPLIKHTDSDETVMPPSSPEIQDAPVEIVADYDADYARKQQQVALSNLDRTNMWLLAQKAYMHGFMTENAKPRDEVEDNALETIVEIKDEGQNAEISASEDTVKNSKKVVRFSDMRSSKAVPRRLPTKLSNQESAFYRAFQDYFVRTQQLDVFVHGLTRFEALQAQRACLRTSHRDRLLGKYQLSVVPQSAKKRLSANVVRGDDLIQDDPEKLRREKETEAMSQSTMAAWQVAATRFLNGGKLISAPVTQRLANISRMSPSQDGTTRDRARILDLGGQTTCDWAWHCALQYPNTKIYTVTTKAVRQMSNSNIKGPPNHRQVAVERLTKLPFLDNQFDLVSARELHGLLKFTGENGEDEWESCLRECMRVLKPGGYLEFSLLDADIMNAGPLGLAKSVEFGFALKTLGYDPSPSKMWLGRLARAGFRDVRRTWMCLPMGNKRRPHQMPQPPTTASASKDGKVCQLDAMVMGSTDSIANVCGLVGSWNWERWLLRCEMEKVAGELRLQDTVTAGVAMAEAGRCLEGVAAVVEEGRAHRSGFRMLTGYAMKPRMSATL